jgi:hypothetical protein
MSDVDYAFIIIKSNASMITVGPYEEMKAEKFTITFTLNDGSTKEYVLAPDDIVIMDGMTLQFDKDGKPYGTIGGEEEESEEEDEELEDEELEEDELEDGPEDELEEDEDEEADEEEEEGGSKGGGFIEGGSGSSASEDEESPAILSFETSVEVRDIDGNLLEHYRSEENDNEWLIDLLDELGFETEGDDDWAEIFEDWDDWDDDFDDDFDDDGEDGTS